MSEYSPIDVKGARILHTMAHPVCLHIVDCLSEAPRRMLDISESTKIANGPNLWRYVRRMVDSGVVVKARSGKEVYYSLPADDVVRFAEVCRRVARISMKNF